MTTLTQMYTSMFVFPGLETCVMKLQLLMYGTFHMCKQVQEEDKKQLSDSAKIQGLEIFI